MKKTIRSISLSEMIDNQLKEDSHNRGLTISANMTRILFEYFQQNGVVHTEKKKAHLNLLSTTQKQSD
jgi:hypothetical protein|tara:strand:- start:21 stop:224 length:204 start_codon:yes stop_codon:yes gene_type:complete